jgi:UDP-N-acetylglucosamine diphosphorylase / glucose-1-phosphate thymidylyltransferase / UDP-N-acetylgalactosamine diphosphorylase / glucosamine-1-phosphate N-acetyltransferase / galactosamine-1-phosphate N-acetyltransferase
MNYILFDDEASLQNLKPFTLTRPVSEIRCGILTITEKWQKYLSQSLSFLTQGYLQQKYPLKIQENNVFINGAVFPNSTLIQKIQNLVEGDALFSGDVLIAVAGKNLSYERKIEFQNSISGIKNLPDIFLKNGEQIENDFDLITNGRESATITDPHTICYGKENIFIEDGANIKAAILNAEQGKIYIGKNAIIQEGSIIIGPFCAGEHSTIAFGSKMRPNTTIGPNSKAGGEVGNCVFFGYSNKAHDGFLGNSVLGEWCNLGANTNTSNLKNDYSNVKLHSYKTNQLEDTGLQFCGTFMGDYSKAGISTMFNTGTVVGVSCNVFGADFQDKFIDSFTWGGKKDYASYRFDKAIAVINATMARREKALSQEEINILRIIQNK